MARGLTAILGAIALAAAAIGTGAGSDPAMAQQASKPKKGIKGTIGYRRAYSYSKQDVVGAENNKRFYDQSLTRQTPGGPFDSGFFFDSAVTRGGGEAPYQQ